jgi:hypothetical protein
MERDCRRMEIVCELFDTLARCTNWMQVGCVLLREEIEKGKEELENGDDADAGMGGVAGSALDAVEGKLRDARDFLLDAAMDSEDSIATLALLVTRAAQGVEEFAAVAPQGAGIDRVLATTSFMVEGTVGSNDTLGVAELCSEIRLSLRAAVRRRTRREGGSEGEGSGSEAGVGVAVADADGNSSVEAEAGVEDGVGGVEAGIEAERG